MEFEEPETDSFMDLRYASALHRRARAGDNQPGPSRRWGGAGILQAAAAFVAVDRFGHVARAGLVQGGEERVTASVES
jgi:hypothetical protein